MPDNGVTDVAEPVSQTATSAQTTPAPQPPKSEPAPQAPETKAAEPKPATDASAADSGKTKAAAPNPEVLDYQGRKMTLDDAHGAAVYAKLNDTELAPEIAKFLDSAKAAKDKPAEPQEVPADKAKPKADAATSQTQPEAKPKSTEGTADSTVDPERLSKAVNALKRAKWPDAQIQSLPEAELMKVGEELAASQSKSDQEYRKALREKESLEQTLRELGVEIKKKAESGTQDIPPKKPDSPTPSPTDDSLAALQNLIDNDLLDDEKAPFVAMLDTIRKRDEALKAREAEIQKKVDEQASKLDERLKAIQRRNDELELDMQRQAMMKSLPVLSDDSKWKAVRSRCFSLSNLDGYVDDNGNPILDRLISHATHQLFEADIKQQQQRELTQRYQRQISGQPEAGDEQNQKPVAALTPDERNAMIFRLLDQGLKRDEVAERMAKIPVK